MNKRMIRKNHFTLVELLVAMAVFSILLLVSMQLFSSSRQLWLNTEIKNRANADARTAMEFITSRIQTMAYTENMPFLIERSRKSKMYFPTAIPMNRKDENGNEQDKIGMRFIGFSLSEDGVLRMHIYSDEGKAGFQNLMPPFARSSGSVADAYTNACNTVKANTVDKTDYSGQEYNLIELMENVMYFELLPKYRDGWGMGNAAGAGYREESKNSPPYALEISLTVMDSKEKFEEWKTADAAQKSSVSDGHIFIFKRSILLNYRGARN